MAKTLPQPTMPISVTEARTQLPAALRAFTSGERVAPIVFGAHRKPEGVILPYAQYEALLRAAALLEDLGDIATLSSRLGRAVDPAQLDDLASVAAELGLEDAIR
jgi:hypothetical protein